VLPASPPGPEPAAPQASPSTQAFQSIRDLYLKGIEPLYNLAFENNWVRCSNQMLNDELFDPNYAGHTGGRMVPIGPVTRSQRFARLMQKGADDPLRNFKAVDEIVRVILDQGEGVTGFRERALALLDQWRKSGTRPYAQALLQLSLSGGASLPEGCELQELLRQSHLYRFAMILQGMTAEQSASAPDGPAFLPCREPLNAGAIPELRQLADELPVQVNACYLVVTAWMSRVYETQNWLPDTSRRKAIEMVASWTLMSLAMRPLLELSSFLPCDCGQLFRPETAGAQSAQAQQLLTVSGKTGRTEQDNIAIDDLAVAVLASTAAWAAQRISALRDAPVADPAKRMILARLRGLSQLDEFARQFPYRVEGGYSDRMPTLKYRQAVRDSARYEEDPLQHRPPSEKPQDPPRPHPLCCGTLVLRLRFSGWGLSQLATDPDPAGDEAGCSGITMLHAADGGRWFDRSILWQEASRRNAILRQPRDKLPPIGVTCSEIALLAANGPAQAGYTPLPGLQLPSVLQNSPVQQELAVSGLLEVLTLRTEEILGPGRKMRVDLKAKNGTQPAYIGLNHLVWQDCEPIDPFILSVEADPAVQPGPSPGTPAAGHAPHVSPSLVLQREVFNQGLSMLEMDPLQRLLSARGPCGAEFNPANIPQWALPPQELLTPGYPVSYLAQRAGALTDALPARLNAGLDCQAEVDEAVSLAERLCLVAAPNPVALGWLRCMIHYAHTLSGDLALGSGLAEVFSSFAKRTAAPGGPGGLQLGVASNGSRDAVNTRWLVNYGLGVMDVDALSNFVWGELYVPVTVQAAGPIQLTSNWNFPAIMESAVAAVACQFSKPFWASYQVDGNIRKLPAATGAITETLTPSPSSSSYSYTLSGLTGVQSFQGQFAAAVSGGETTLAWTVAFTCVDTASAVTAVGFVAAAAQQMTAALTESFGPRY